MLWAEVVYPRMEKSRGTQNIEIKTKTEVLMRLDLGFGETYISVYSLDTIKMGVNLFSVCFLEYHRGHEGYSSCGTLQAQCLSFDSTVEVNMPAWQLLTYPSLSVTSC